MEHKYRAMYNIKENVKLIYQRGMSQERQALIFGILVTLEKPSTKYKQGPLTITTVNCLNE